MGASLGRSRAGTRFGKYELITLLGRGGMGEVYEARDTDKGRVIALKILLEQFALGKRFDLVGHAAPQGFADGYDGKRRGLGNFRRQRHGGASHIGLADQLIGEAHGKRLIAGNAPAAPPQTMFWAVRRLSRSV